jgi:hypothetical protein
VSDISLILGLVISFLQLSLTTVYTIYMGKQLRCMREQIHQFTETQEKMIAHERRNKAFELISRWSSKDMADMRCRAGTAIQKRVQLEVEKHAIFAYLSFLEEMAMAVLSEAADEGLCKEFFRSPFLYAYDSFGDALKANSGKYSYIHKLEQRWR